MHLIAPVILHANDAYRIMTDKSDYKIGDIITITIEIPGQGYRLGKVEKEKLHPFEVASTENLYDEESGRTTILIRGTVFETGKFEIPPFKILDEKGEMFETEPVELKILSLLQQNEENLKDIKPQVQISERGPLWPWFILFLLPIILLVIAIYFLKKKRKMLEKPASKAIPPNLEALLAIEKIEKNNLPGNGKVKEFYTRIGDTIRIFLGKVYHIDAMEMTTDELISELTGDEAPLLEKTRRLLNQCDMVKFARHIPPQIDIDSLSGKAREIVERLTTEVLQAPPKNLDLSEGGAN